MYMGGCRNCGLLEGHQNVDKHPYGAQSHKVATPFKLRHMSCSIELLLVDDQTNGLEGSEILSRELTEASKWSMKSSCGKNMGQLV